MHKISSALCRVSSPIPTRPEAQLNLTFLSGQLSKSAQRYEINLLLLISVVCRGHQGKTSRLIINCNGNTPPNKEGVLAGP